MSQGSLFTSDVAPEDSDGSSDAVSGPAAEIVKTLLSLNPDELTPMQALIHLSKLKEIAENL